MSPRISPTKMCTGVFSVATFLLLFNMVVELHEPRDLKVSWETYRLPKYTKKKNSFSVGEIDGHDVLILAYMNSGSSFVGKLLGGRDDTFYWYEPLWMTHKWRYLAEGGQICDFRRDECKQGLDDSPTSVGRALAFLSEIYSCTNLTQYYEKFMADLMGNPDNTGHTGNIYRSCMADKSADECMSNDVSQSERNCSCNKDNDTRQCVSASRYCFDMVMKECQKAKHRVTKVLRMDTSLAQTLLDQHPRLKLVQVFRDPRATINSRINTPWFYKNRFYNFSIMIDVQTLCRRINKDLANAERLAILYPGRVKIVQYEDFYDPHRLARALYNFTGMMMTNSAVQMVDDIARDKSAFHPDNYRTSLAWDIVNEMNKNCIQQFKRLGLRVFESERELRDLNLSLVVDVLPYSID